MFLYPLEDRCFFSLSQESVPENMSVELGEVPKVYTGVPGMCAWQGKELCPLWWGWSPVVPEMTAMEHLWPQSMGGGSVRASSCVHSSSPFLCQGEPDDSLPRISSWQQCTSPTQEPNIMQSTHPLHHFKLSLILFIGRG